MATPLPPPRPASPRPVPPPAGPGGAGLAGGRALALCPLTLRGGGGGGGRRERRAAAARFLVARGGEEKEEEEEEEDAAQVPAAAVLRLPLGAGHRLLHVLGRQRRAGRRRQEGERQSVACPLPLLAPSCPYFFLIIAFFNVSCPRYAGARQGWVVPCPPPPPIFSSFLLFFFIYFSLPPRVSVSDAPAVREEL